MSATQDSIIEIKIPSVHAAMSSVISPGFLLSNILCGGISEKDRFRPILVTPDGKTPCDYWVDERAHTTQYEGIVNYGLLSSNQVATVIAKQNKWFYFPAGESFEGGWKRSLSLTSFLGALEGAVQAEIKRSNEYPSDSEDRRSYDKGIERDREEIKALETYRPFLEDDVTLAKVVGPLNNRLWLIGNTKGRDLPEIVKGAIDAGNIRLALGREVYEEGSVMASYRELLVKESEVHIGLVSHRISCPINEGVEDVVETAQKLLEENYETQRGHVKIELLEKGDLFDGSVYNPVVKTCISEFAKGIHAEKMIDMGYFAAQAVTAGLIERGNQIARRRAESVSGIERVVRSILKI
jgi:hypothetical protein